MVDYQIMSMGPDSGGHLLISATYWDGSGMAPAEAYVVRVESEKPLKARIIRGEYQAAGFVKEKHTNWDKVPIVDLSDRILELANQGFIRSITEDEFRPIKLYHR